MKKGTKKVLIISAIALGIAFLMPVVGIEAEKKEPKIEKEYTSMSPSEKDKAVFNFINYNEYKEAFGQLNFEVISLINRSVKHPETIEFLKKDEWIKGENVFILEKNNFRVGNTDKGEMQIIIDFRSENKLSQKVRSKAIMSLLFKAKDGYSLTDFQIK